MFYRYLFALLLLPLTAAQAAEWTVEVHNFEFSPAELTIQPGDTVTWVNQEGSHNVKADDGSFYSGFPDSGNWQFSQTFNSPGDNPYYCEPHGGPGGVGMSGVIKVAAETGGYDIRMGHSGSWWNPEWDGQGFAVEVLPADAVLVAYWFTYDSDGNQDWFLLSGPYAGSSASLDIYRMQGGVFVTPGVAEAIPVGEGSLQFSSCDAARLEYTLDGTSDSIDLQRLTPNVACP